MERSRFLKNGIAALGAAFVMPLANSCKKDVDTGTVGYRHNRRWNNYRHLHYTPTETDGPFPTKTPSSLVSANIVSDRTVCLLL